jgi:hypothetical protein
MKIFVSSLIGGMEPIRAAAKAAIEELGHTPVMAEDFVPSPKSPQVACLSGVREAGITVLVLGAEYGVRQASGYSATEEEFREARETRPVIAFVQNGVTQTADQKAFVKEVQGWSAGYFRGAFDGPDDLRRKIVRALHEWELSNASGPVDQAQLTSAALAMMPKSDRGRSSGRGPSLVIGVVSGPPHAILRPSEIEGRSLKEKLLKEAIFGPHRIFDSGAGSDARLHGGALQISQDRGAEFILDPQGAIRIRMPVPSANEGNVGVSAIIEEDVRDMLRRGLSFADWVLSEIDPTQLLTHSAPAVAIAGATIHTWRTRRQHDASPDRVTLRMFNEDQVPVMLSPPVRPRTALCFDADRMVDDFITLLGRAYRTE